VFIGKRAFLRSTRSNMIGSTLFDRPAGSGAAEAAAWQAAVIANGGTVSAGRLTIVSNFIASEKAAGTWALTDDYWGLWGENAPQALTSLKQRRLATVTAAPTFAADRHYAFDGSTQFIDTGFVPSTHAVAMTPDSCRLAVYERTSSSGNTYTAGCGTTTNQHMAVRPRASASIVIVLACSGSATASSGASISTGYTVGARRGATVNDVAIFKNGLIRTVTTPPPGVVASLPTFSLYIGGENSAGTLFVPRVCSVGFVAIGASLSDAQELAQYNNIQAWAGAIGAAIDADADAWAAEVVTNGGTVSAARLDIVSSFIAAEKTAGTWALTDDYWGLWAENAPQALTSLKQRRLATLTAAPTFTADRGYTFNGTTQYLDTGFIPSTHGVALVINNARLALYDRLDVTGAAGIGCQVGNTNSMLIMQRNTTNVTARILEAELINRPLSPADARGFTAASRAGTTALRTFKNGVSLGDGTTATLSATLPTVSLYIGSCNGLAQFHNSQIGVACAGGPLSDAQEAAQYANVQAWATAVGANV
jgi:hypothetical protein